MALAEKTPKPDIAAPEPNGDWALFLDIDGTLIDIAASPSAVEVPATLMLTLAAASAWLGGALAVVSGRPLSEIDRLLAPLRLPGGAEHGAIIRFPDGTLDEADGACAVPAAWRARLHRAVQPWGGVWVEEKSYGAVVHFRTAPSHENDVLALVSDVARENTAEFEVLPASMAFEIRHRAISKGKAVDRLMAAPPFFGRIPVFVGDDVTDKDGFEAVRAKGGIALNVDEFFGGKPAEVRRWLHGFRSAHTV